MCTTYSKLNVMLHFYTFSYFFIFNVVIVNVLNKNRGLAGLGRDIPSYFFGSAPCIFSSQSFSYFLVRPTFFWVSPSHFFEPDLPILFSKLLFNSLEFIQQLLALIKRSLTWDVNRDYNFNEETGLAEILTSSFYAGFTYIEIVEFLNMYHGHQISFSTLKKVKALDLHRRSLIPWRATVE